MTRPYLSQELGLVYYRTMSKFAQYRRNVLKNNISSIQAKYLQNKVSTQEVKQ